MRKRRYLIGVAASAIALISLIGAGAAGAAQFATEEPAPVKATPQSGSFTLPNSGLYCKTMSLSGSTTAGSAETIALDPVVEGCTFAGFSVTLPAHGCKFVLHAGPGALLYGPADITCPEKASMSMEFAGCKVSVPAQTGIGGIDYESIGAGVHRETRVISDLQGLTYVLTGSCSKTGTFHDGFYSGTSLMSEHRANGEQVGLWVELSEPGANVFRALNGGELTGEVSGFRINAAGAHLECSAGTMAGETASLEMSKVTLSPSLEKSKCQMLGVPTALTAGKCTISFNAPRTLEVGGVSCASSPISLYALGCTIQIGPQVGLSTVNYANKGLGNGHYVSAGLEISSLKYTSSSCPKNGTFSDGSMTGEVALRAGGSLTVE